MSLKMYYLESHNNRGKCSQHIACYRRGGGGDRKILKAFVKIHLGKKDWKGRNQNTCSLVLGLYWFIMFTLFFCILCNKVMKENESLL